MRRTTRHRLRRAVFDTLEDRRMFAIPAFPGAEGAGAYATGGRGGDVYHVTNLNSSGAGSFANGVATIPAAGRTIVFDVGGYIPLPSELRVTSSKLTIAGQTAPGDGVGFRSGTFWVSGDDIVARYLRFYDNRGGDAVDFDSGSANSIFDHTIVAFGNDENLSTWSPPENFTFQSSINAWGLETHSAGGLWNLNHASSIDSLWIHNHTRNPKARPGVLDFVNNVVADYDIGFIMGDSETPATWQANVRGTTFISTSAKTVALEKANLDRNGNPNFALYMDDTVLDGNANGVLDVSRNNYSMASGNYIKATTPFVNTGVPITIDDHLTAYKKVVSSTGPVRFGADGKPIRDELNSIAINELVNQIHHHVSNVSQTGASNGGYGALNSAPAPADSDRDGMPDYWEAALGLNPGTDDHNGLLASSGGIVTSNSFMPPSTPAGYTNLEEYLHFLANPYGVVAKNASAGSSFIDIDLRKYTSGFTASPVFTLSNITGGSATLQPDGHTVRFVPTLNTFGRAKFNFKVADAEGSQWTQTFNLLVSSAGVPRNLVWKGDNTTNNWDTSSNTFLKDNTATAFSPGDNVTIDDTGSNTPAINVTGTVLPGGLTFNADKNYVLGGAGAIGGTTALLKSGNGSLTINNANSFGGPVTLNAGSIILNSINANGSGLGTGAISLNGASLTFFNAGLGTFAGTLANPVSVNAPTTITFAPRMDVTGAFTGSAPLTAYIPYVRTEMRNDWSNFTGQLNVTTDADGGEFRIQTTTGFAKTRLNLPDRISAYYVPTIPAAGVTIDIGELTGSALAVLRGGSTASVPFTWRIGALNTSSTFAGGINENPSVATITGLAKVGAGTLTLSGTSNYTGTTTVSAGTLLLNGNLGNTAITVASGATLSGVGRVGNPTGGSVTALAGSFLKPGTPNTLGPLTVGQNLTLSGATIALRLSNSPSGQNDQLQLNGGALTLTATNTLQLTFTDGYLGAGTYNLVTGGASTTGGLGNLNVALPTGSRQTYTLSVQVGKIVLTVSGAPANLTWIGSNNSGAWDLNATTNWTGGANTFFNLDSTLFNDSAATGNVTLLGSLQPGPITVANNTLPYTFTGAGSVDGQASLTKSGSQPLTINTANTYTGGTTINNSTILLGNDTANASGLGSGPVTLNGGTVKMYDNNVSSGVSTWNLVVPTGQSGTIWADARSTIAGALTGGGTLNLRDAWIRNDLVADWSAFTGQINLLTDTDGGDFRFGTSYAYPAFPSATLNLPDNLAMYYIGIVEKGPGTFIDVGALNGSPSSTLRGGATGGRILTYRVGAKNTNATFAGTIQEQNTSAVTSFIKTGTGVWTLSGNASWNGDTTVEQGTLRLSGTLTTATQLRVKAGATLDLAGGTLTADSIILEPGASLTGLGTINADITIDGSMTVPPGTTLTINGNVTNSGTLDARNATLNLNADFINNGTFLSPTPTLRSSLVNDGSQQRSVVKTFTLRFSHPVTLSPGALTLTRRGDTAPTPFTLSDPNGQRMTYTLTFTNLPDGVYDLQLSATSIRDDNTNALAANQTLTFTKKTGDATGDGAVNFADLVLLAQNYLSPTPTAGDLDDDGSVTFTDLVILAQNYNTTLAAPTPTLSANAAQSLAATWSASLTPTPAPRKNLTPPLKRPKPVFAKKRL